MGLGDDRTICFTLMNLFRPALERGCAALTERFTTGIVPLRTTIVKKKSVFEAAAGASPWLGCACAGPFGPAPEGCGRPGGVALDFSTGSTYNMFGSYYQVSIPSAC